MHQIHGVIHLLKHLILDTKLKVTILGILFLILSYFFSSLRSWLISIIFLYVLYFRPICYFSLFIPKRWDLTFAYSCTDLLRKYDQRWAIQERKNSAYRIIRWSGQLFLEVGEERVFVVPVHLDLHNFKIQRGCSLFLFISTYTILNPERVFIVPVHLHAPTQF